MKLIVNIDAPDLARAIEFYTVARAIAAGARLEGSPVEWRGSRCVTFADAFGHGFCLLQFTDGKSYED